MIFTDESGQQYEYLGDSLSAISLQGATHYLDSTSRDIREIVAPVSDRPKFRKVTKRHTFGRVVFEETGESRTPQKGEWYLYDNHAVIRTGSGMYPSNIELIILREVGILPQEES